MENARDMCSVLPSLVIIHGFAHVKSDIFRNAQHLKSFNCPIVLGNMPPASIS